MDTLHSVDSDQIIDWRVKRKAYLKGIRGHNAGHAIKLAVRPVRDFVNPTLWEAVSRKKLLPHHRTKCGEDPNHEQCTNYFSDMGEYMGTITRETQNAMDVLASVKYPAGRKGSTHEDRWLFYIAKRDKQLDKVPDAQLNNPIFKKQHAAHLRKIVEPPALRDLVEKAYKEGIHPDTR